jgi:ribosomal protein S18 acetylase RimI-like enzyme
MIITVSTVAPHDLPPIREALMDIYRAAFAPPPFNETEDGVAHFGQALAGHAEHPAPGFRCCVAREDGRLVGFVYGFTVNPGYRRSSLLRAALTPDIAQRWLVDAFDVIDLGVLPEAQGRGIGGRLHDAVLAGQPHRTAVLPTDRGETAAMRLYRSRGWQVVQPEFFFPGSDTPYVILGLDVPQRVVMPGGEVLSS